MPAIHRTIRLAVRQIVIGAMSMVALAVLVFGPRANDAYPKDRVIVDYWEKWGGIEEQGMRQIVEDFNNTVGKEKKIFIRYLSTSGIETKTLVATAGGVPPDIAGLYDQNITQYAALESLEPLDEMAAQAGITQASYKKVYWDACHYNGHLYGLVSTAYDLGLYYNTDIFKKHASDLRAAGCDPDRPPRTIDELDRYAKALETYDAKGRLATVGFLPMEPGWYQKYFCLYFGGRWWDPVHQKFTFTDARVVKAYTWLQSYSKRLGANNETSFRSGVAAGGFESPQNPFMAEISAMELQGTFLGNFIVAYGPSLRGKWAAAPFPTADANLTDVTYCNADVLVIPRGAKHKKEAFEFIAFVNRQDEMEKLANSHCKISPLRNVSEEFFAHHKNPYVRVFDRLAASPNAHPTEPVPILAEVNGELDPFVQRLTLLNVTPEEGLQQVQERLQKKYDEFMDVQRRRKARFGSRYAEAQ